MMIDLSHQRDGVLGTWPRLSTRAGRHALERVRRSASTRNLTDKQLDAIKEIDGMVGVNDAAVPPPNGKRDSDTPLSQVVDHIDYLMRHVGEDCVGLGSDFDGAMIPKNIGTPRASRI